MHIALFKFVFEHELSPVGMIECTNDAISLWRKRTGETFFELVHWNEMSKRTVLRKRIRLPITKYIYIYLNVVIYMQTLHNTHIHLICPVRAGVGICKLNVSGFRCHPLPANFSCTKLVLLLDIANWCVLPCYFNGIILIMNTLACSANSFTVYCTLLFFSLFPYSG